jgi:hypothetical protein
MLRHAKRLQKPPCFAKAKYVQSIAQINNFLSLELSATCRQKENVQQFIQLFVIWLWFMAKRKHYKNLFYQKEKNLGLQLNGVLKNTLL